MVRLSLHLIQTPNINFPIKEAAGSIVSCIVEYRPKHFVKSNMIAPVLTLLMNILAYTTGCFFRTYLVDEVYDEKEMEINKLAQRLIDTMALHIPSNAFFDLAICLVAQGINVSDAKMRKASCGVLGIIAEGCRDQMRENLSQVLPILLKCTTDKEHYVREWAWFALGQFSEHCQPDILYFNQMILPLICQSLADPCLTVQNTVCYVLEYFCEHLQSETLKPFLVPLMDKLIPLLHSEQNSTKELALTAIATTAVTTKTAFLPFVQVSKLPCFFLFYCD
jgi:hypothetical protein